MRSVHRMHYCMHPNCKSLEPRSALKNATVRNGIAVSINQTVKASPTSAFLHRIHGILQMG